MDQHNIKDNSTYWMEWSTIYTHQ